MNTTPSSHPQQPVDDPRIAPVLERMQQLLEEHPPIDGILVFRGMPADGEPLDRVDDPDLAATIARARREHDRECEREAELATAEAESVAPAAPELGVDPEHTTPTSAPRPPPIANGVTRRGGGA